jgi:hypothetical protein
LKEKIILAISFSISILVTSFFVYEIFQSLETVLIRQIKNNEKTIIFEPIINTAEQRIEIVTTAKISAYPPQAQYTDSTPYITAFNEPVRDGIVAISKPLEKDFGLKHGDEIIVPSVGRYVIADRMSQTRWKDYRVDIFMWCPKRCRKFGIMETPIIIIKKTS